jgi:hypothetical protein
MLLENRGQGRQGLRRLRDRTSDYLSDIAVRAAHDDFSFHSKTIGVDSAVLVDVRMSAVRIDRTSRHIARGGLDDYQIALCVDGQAIRGGSAQRDYARWRCVPHGHGGAQPYAALSPSPWHRTA